MSRRAPRLAATRLAATGALLGAGALLASCGGSAPGANPPVASPSTSVPTSLTPASSPPGSSGPGSSASAGPIWLVEDFTLALLERNGLPAATITKLFDSPRTLLIVRPNGAVPDSLVPRATRVQSFASFDALRSAIQDSTLEPGVRDVLYDDEDWAFTPAAERSAPFAYAALALALAHAHGLHLIFAPAANLAPVLSPGYSTSDQLGSGSGKFSGYTGLNLAGQGAAASDIFEIQGQQAEGQPGFTAFVRQAVGQARAAAAGHPVLLGISTAVPGGGTVSPATLAGVVSATRSLVDGYWLNVPGTSPQCPDCGQVHAGPAVSFLESYAAGPTG